MKWKEVNKWRLRHKRVLVVFISGESYLVTRDLVPTLERKIGLTLSPFLRERIRLLEESFISELWKYIPEEINRIATGASTTSQELETIARSNGLPVVSLDRVYLTNADGYLEVTRVTDPNTGELTISSRPGNPKLEDQISQLKGYSEVNLVDVGAFEGDTLLEVCSLLEENRITVKEVFLGYSSIAANEKVSETKEVTTLNLFEFYEWIELRDFFGIDGRRIADQPGCFIPYWENLTEWASIPGEYEKEVRALCQDYNKRLLSLLSKEDLVRIGEPIAYGGKK